MKIQELLATAWQSLIANPKRSLLTVIGIVIGIASVITIISLGNGVEQATLKNLQTTQTGKQSITIDYIPYNPSKPTPGFNQSDIDLLTVQHDIGIDKATLPKEPDNPFQSNVLVNDANQTASLSLVKPTQLTIIAGYQISAQDRQLKNQVAMISRSFAKKCFRTTINALHTALIINGYSYQVIGVISTDNSADIYLPKETYLANQTSTSGNRLKLTFQTGSNVSKQAKKAVKLLQQSGSQRSLGDYYYFDAGALLSGISKVIKGLTYFISAIAGISLFIAGIGVMNMMYISVSERTKEIGIRLAIGATPTLIMWQFLLEAIILTVSGGLIGFALGYGTAVLISLMLPFNAVITLNTFFLAFGVSSSVGLVFGILPAKQAADKNLIDILR
ncbi:ABC transporter permease [Lacticaseibacillus paracasei]|uniref:ABC transporter permease n=3 Tax=Lacticaseibacillus paracasei TaxID=1597 RepID=A0A829HB22_LACPA|nr:MULTISPECIES: ABC transporter permease [Lactobacillaceae]EKQ18731.1 FtsX family cell division protein [Lacticaseibacillus casei UW4]EPC76241.1 ABC transporter permease [Lacticaseibacillus paracasei subsp. paracasei Lpp41]MED9788113.1 ABC transporter permease [Latilactobacillus curvatus]ATH00534.1 cell division protein FtsX [Lacticaseibacillus paracasei]EEI68163.1 efflux ABC transporter, permease protein [Lacticaseibacillus paracasei subsp. paracasei ATCC 25302 = DSM 5622 = JCM 8130]